MFQRKQNKRNLNKLETKYYKMTILRIKGEKYKGFKDPSAEKKKSICFLLSPPCVACLFVKERRHMANIELM